MFNKIYIILTILCVVVKCNNINSNYNVEKQVSTNNKPSNWTAVFTPDKITVAMDETQQVLLEIIVHESKEAGNYSFRLQSSDSNLAQSQLPAIPSTALVNGTWLGNVTIEGLFLGMANISVELKTSDNDQLVSNNDEPLKVIVIKRERTMDHVFTGSVILLVSLLYINFGAALDLAVLRNILICPTGPLVGCLMQFIVLPLLSYALGLLIFPNVVALQLGLFATGISPSGGASNMWTVILGGNVSLSVLLTAISNFAAILLIPFWLFTLGGTLFDRADIELPYVRIASYVIALIIPISIGLVIQRCSTRVAGLLVRLIKPISSVLILFIVIFAILTNLYLFNLFSWQIILAGLGLPWLGYILAWMLAKLVRQNPLDALTIAIECGIQNTGIAILLLRVSLPQPQADLTTVMPVAVALMTPLPLFGIYLYKRFMTLYQRNRQPKHDESTSSEQQQIATAQVPTDYNS